MLEVYEIVTRFDKLAMHKTLESKTEWLVTDTADRTKLKPLRFGAAVPKVPQHIELADFTVSTAK